MGIARAGLPCWSVVVPAYNEGDLVGACVRALVDQSVPREQYEVIVVDDASTDGTAAIATGAGADRVLAIEHGGAAAARNAGLAAAAGELVLFTDADCVPCHEWIEHMVSPFAEPSRRRQGHIPNKAAPPHRKAGPARIRERYERMARLSQIDFIDTYAAAYRRSVLIEEGDCYRLSRSFSRGCRPVVQAGDARPPNGIRARGVGLAHAPCFPLCLSALQGQVRILACAGVLALPGQDRR